jgi:hypothetical protein
MLDPTDNPLPYRDRLAYAAGDALAKAAGDQVPAYNLSGLLYVSAGGWGLLSVPNALVRGVFDAMTEPGIELPLSGASGQLNAHVTVFRKEELDMLGGPDAIKNDRGKPFRYTLGRLVAVEPAGWPEVEKCWMLRVHSPELQQLRRSHGLSPRPKNNEYDFHVTVAVRKRGVLGRNDKAKDTAAA